jgi:hypothetical protein
MAQPVPGVGTSAAPAAVIAPDGKSVFLAWKGLGNDQRSSGPKPGNWLRIRMPANIHSAPRPSRRPAIFAPPTVPHWPVFRATFTWRGRARQATTPSIGHDGTVQVGSRKQKFRLKPESRLPGCDPRRDFSCLPGKFGQKPLVGDVRRVAHPAFFWRGGVFRLDLPQCQIQPRPVAQLTPPIDQKPSRRVPHSSGPSLAA